MSLSSSKFYPRVREVYAPLECQLRPLNFTLGGSPETPFEWHLPIQNVTLGWRTKICTLVKSKLYHRVALNLNMEFFEVEQVICKLSPRQK